MVNISTFLAFITHSLREETAVLGYFGFPVAIVHSCRVEVKQGCTGGRNEVFSGACTWCMDEAAKVSVPAKPLRKEFTPCHLGWCYNDEVKLGLRSQGGLLQR